MDEEALMALIKKTRVSAVVNRLLRAEASRWFFLAAALLVVFLAYTLLVAAGVLNASTARVEQWLLGRPVTRVDCLFYEWRNLGNAVFIAFLVLVVGGICLLLGYRWPVLPALLLLLGICLLCEGAGKAVFTQRVPYEVSIGMPALGCPQIHGQPIPTRLSAAAGMWWNLPSASPQLGSWLQRLSQSAFSSGWSYPAASYPGGHAMRWSFLGALACWLCWRHVKRRAMRVPLMLLSLVAALGAGFMQFYVGAHLITDTLAGYLFGGAAACCAIGILLFYRGQRSAAGGAA